VIETVATRLVLRDGGKMAVRIVQPPQPDYAARLCAFLEHKSLSR
jgi:hypothetical protein